VQAFIARAITLPSQGEVGDNMPIADPDAIHAVHKFVTQTIARQLEAELLHAVDSNRSSAEYSPDTLSKARRALKNTALGYLASLNEPEITEMALKDFR
jgi:aminopeptidase N